MAQNNNNSIVIGFSIAALLAVVFGVLWYLDNATVQTLTAQLQSSKNGESDLKDKVSQQIDQLNEVRALVAPASAQTTPEDLDPENDLTLNTGRSVLAEIAGDGTAASGNLIDSLRSTKSESNQNQMTATIRQKQIEKAATDLQNTIVSKDVLIEENRKARDRAEQELAKKEAMHAEQMKGLEDQIRTLTAEKAEKDAERARLQTTLQQERLAWNDRREEMTGWLVNLRARLREREDLTFSKPDGLVTAIDHNEGLVFLDLGFGDDLQKGIGFSVYKKNHSGVGRVNTSDVKGKIEVTEILGLHRSVAKIVEQKNNDPIAPDDPIYSPIFQAGQTLEIAIVGQINVDGLNRKEFRRLVLASGSKISVEVGRQGQFTDSDGLEISKEAAVASITPRTRFLVIGDVGDVNSSSADTNQEAVFQQMRENKAALEEKCAGLGIYPIGLSSFLEHIGFSPKQTAWTADSGKPHPSILVNGARSAATNGRIGNRESGAAISGLYTDRTRPSPVSTGSVSKIYSGK
ncbi:MAG: DUF4200 domain-containing protein [Fuerstiella sp.]